MARSVGTLRVPIVSVVWTDAVFDMDNIPIPQDMCTIGALVSKTKKAVSVAHMFCAEDHSLVYRGTTTIPRKMVKKITLITRSRISVL